MGKRCYRGEYGKDLLETGVWVKVVTKGYMSKCCYKGWYEIVLEIEGGIASVFTEVSMATVVREDSMGKCC